jgi:multidrug efflux system outer membrane protein
MSKFLSAAIFPLFILSGCAVGPDYQMPSSELGDSFAREDNAYYQKGATPVTWWKSFKDPVLTELIERAVKDNHDVRVSLSRINQSRAVARESFSELLPGVQANAAYEKARSSGARFSGEGGGSFDYELYTAGLDALWEVDIFGRLRRGLESKNAQYEANVAELRDTIRMLVAEIGGTYFELRGSQKRLGIAKRNIELQRETLALVKAKFETGQISELDVLRARTQLERTLANVAPLDNEVQRSMHRLAILLGKQPRDLEIDLEEVSEVPQYSGPLNIGKPSELLRRRPDIRMAERSLASETALVGVAIANFFPVVSISGSLGVEASTVSDWTNGAGTYGFGPSLTWSPLDTGKNMARVKAQKARVREALLNYEKTVLLALEDTENALVRFRTEKERILRINRALDSAQKAHNIARAQYDEGVLDFLSVIDAQDQVLDNEDELAVSQQNIGLAIVGIYKALGGGWEAWSLIDEDDEHSVGKIGEEVGKKEQAVTEDDSSESAIEGKIAAEADAV